MFTNMEQVIEANPVYFSPSTMRFFNSRVESELIDGRWFVTSEQEADDRARLYTVRGVAADGTVSTVGEFQAHESLADALLWLGGHRALT